MKDRRDMATKTSASSDANTFVTKAGKGRSIIKCRKDEIVFSQGEPADAVFYVQRGRVKITVVSPQGKEAVIALLGPDEFFGEGCLSGQPHRMSTVRAIAESALMRIEKAALSRLIRDVRSFSEMFMAHVLARSTRLEEDLVDQLFNSSEKRLARLLLLLANYGKDQKPEPMIAKISQETLAEMIGTTRARVSFFMNKFRKLGFIRYNGGIEVQTSLLNAILHDLPQTNSTHARKPQDE
jgi:CRP/FNR family transcriptional regulator, cyclic AMP receptor protein